MGDEHFYAEQVAADMLGDDGPANLPVELRARLRRVRDLLVFVGGVGCDLRSRQVIATIVEQCLRDMPALAEESPADEDGR